MEKFNLKTFAKKTISDGAGDDQEYINYLNRLAETEIECHLDHDTFPSPPPEIQLYLEEIVEVQTNIEDLEKELVTQRAKLISTQRALKNHLIGKEPVKRERGKPKENDALQVAAKRFVGMWVKSVLTQLGARSCAELEKYVLGSDGGNWRRWKRGGAVPSSSLLMFIITTNISKGKFKGKCLIGIPTNPPTRKLLDLINLLREVGN